MDQVDDAQNMLFRVCGPFGIAVMNVSGIALVYLLSKPRGRQLILLKSGGLHLNVDASFFEHLSLTGAGVIVRDDEGEFVLCKTITRHCIMSVDEGEAWALLQALSWVSNLGIDKIEFETDSKRLCDALRSVNTNLYAF
ncbi:hypothetical protein ACS0TY_012751 [Phlomoides rotata]